MAEDLILHHYEASPYCEKVRLALGYKGLPWRSVMMPPVLPKPLLFALTGGYRRAPVLQVGADVYCDSALILQEIDRRYPTPPFATGPAAAAAALAGRLADVDLFWRAVRHVMGVRAHALPEALLADRQAMHPHADLDRDRLAAGVPHGLTQLGPLLGMLDEALGGSPFFGGERPAQGDFAVYHPLWFLRGVGGVAQLAPACGRLVAWMEAMAAFGYGHPSPFTAEEAVVLAAGATPKTVVEASTDGGPAPGDLVVVCPEGYPKEAVEGRLCRKDAHSIVVARPTPQGSLVHVHFPRLGYALERATPR